MSIYRLRKLFIFNLVFVALLNSYSNAQIKQSTSKPANDTTKKNEWEADIDYITKSVFLGRTDSLPSGYLTPAIAFYHKSGLYGILATAILQQNTGSFYNATSITGGYDKELSHHFLGEVELTKNFFPNNNSSSINDNILFDGKASIANYNAIINSKLTFHLFFSNNIDEAFVLKESHPFYNYFILNLNDSLFITPTFRISAGTQEYYVTYTSTVEKKFGKKKTVESIDIKSLFQIMDYELSLPVYYYYHRFYVDLTPVYSIGINIPGRATSLNIFYVDIGAGITW